MRIFPVDGQKGYMFQGIFFTEGFPDSAQTLGECSTSSNVQNTNLDWLREKLASQVKSRGGNALIGFRYVQKANIFSFSSVSWQASGSAALIENLSDLEQQSVSETTSSRKNCPMCGEDIAAIAKKCKHCGEFL
jgi:hypothetical protein